VNQRRGRPGTRRLERRGRRPCPGPEGVKTVSTAGPGSAAAPERTVLERRGGGPGARVLVLALVAMVAFSGCEFLPASDEPDLVAYFRDVGDLVEAGQVQVNDVEIGTITDIGLELVNGDMVARVSMDLDDSTRIPAQDLTAVVRQTSLLGEQFVQLIPAPTDGPMVGTETVEIPITATDRRVDIEAFLSELSAFVGGGGLEDLNRFTHAQALILEDRGERFGQAIEELDTFTTVLANRRHDLGAAIDSLASASGTLVGNRETLHAFLDSLDEANVLLAEQGGNLGRLFASLRRFGTVNSRFLARHEGAINRQFKALRPILRGLAGSSDVLATDIVQLRTFFQLFPKSMGGGPSGKGAGDYVQVDAILCEEFASCQTKGEKGDVPGQGFDR